MKKEGDSIERTYDNVVSSLGATVVISLVLFSSWATSFLPNGVLLSIGLFFSLPIFFDFIFGIYFNNPNFSVKRRYGFFVYMVFALGLFYYFSPPQSVTNGFLLLMQFIAGFVISIVSGLLYIAPYNLLKKYSYRVKAIISFIISFALTYAILFALKYWGVIAWLE